jgi:PAS domain S-box-containing protein
MERVMKEEDFIVSKTDTKGKITYVNRIFMEMAGYSDEELLGKPHNIIRHPDMPKAVFKLLWDRITGKKEIFAYVINKSKNGDYYWVYANVTASTNVRGEIVGYYSVRRKPNPAALTVIKPLYKKMLDAERHGGVEASMKLLKDVLYEKGVGYDEFIIDIQK